jgi:multimeric flavodoxin WrbA
MKIVGIFGSMREKGNSDWMLDTLLNAAEAEGAEVERVYLRKLEKLSQCTGCDSCAKTGECCIKDDMQEVYPKLIQAKVIVVATPNYFKNVSGLTKLFIDRTNALLRQDRQLKKRYGIGLLVGGEELEDTQYCEDALNRFFKGHKMKTLRMIKARADEKGQASKIKALETELVQVGKGIAKEDIEIIDSVLWEHKP